MSYGFIEYFYLVSIKLGVMMMKLLIRRLSTLVRDVENAIESGPLGVPLLDLMIAIGTTGILIHSCHLELRGYQKGFIILGIFFIPRFISWLIPRRWIIEGLKQSVITSSILVLLNFLVGASSDIYALLRVIGFNIAVSFLCSYKMDGWRK